MIHPAGPPGLIIAAPRSGAGKTTVTVGLLGALRRRGLAVQPFKCGPDYIDPAFHEVAAGHLSYNLDSWAMGAGLIATLAATASMNAEISVAEGVMGLFDGAAARGQSGSGTTADLASLLGWPVVLVGRGGGGGSEEGGGWGGGGGGGLVGGGGRSGKIWVGQDRRSGVAAGVAGGAGARCHRPDGNGCRRRTRMRQI